MKKFRLIIPYFVLLIVSCFPGFACPARITPLMDSDKMMTLDGEWKFRLLLGKPVLPERFDEESVVMDGVPGASDTSFYRKGFDVSSWSRITVPGCWEMQGFSTPTYGVVPSQAGLYKRTFTLPADWDGGHLFVRFKGVLYSYRVWINGTEVGRWDQAYNAASFEISSLVRRDESNEIAVRVDTRSPSYLLDKNDNWALSGIFRSVDLLWFPERFIEDCYVRTRIPAARCSPGHPEPRCSPGHPERSEGSHKGLVEAELSFSGTAATSHLVRARLFSPAGRLVATRSCPADRGKATLRFPVTRPELWSAETPSLYTLEIKLLQGSRTVQTLKKKVGIREISVKDGVLLLNGAPIKLRGVNSHDLDPETGKTLTLESMERDVRMWKEGNINFLRGCHYAQDERKLDLCDSLGIYVACEVSFNFWRDKDTSLVDDLVSRGEATVLRDRSHPSVIIWNIGNEEPICENTVRVARKVRSLDPTRLITYPGTGEEDTLPPEADLYSPHYPDLNAVRAWKSSGRPYVATEYAHSLGLAFGSDFREIWKVLFNRPDMAGGAVWHFQDQGILRNAALPVDRSALTADVWIDPTHYWAASIEGCDGIVYADRTPQSDWYLVRDTYSPVQILERRLSPVPGGELSVRVCNQYDFLNLESVNGRWSLERNGQEVSSGPLHLSCPPHDTVSVRLPLRAPENPGSDIWTLSMAFTDQAGRAIYEHSLDLTPATALQTLREEILASLPQERAADIPSLIPLARTGRAPRLADVTVRDRHYGGENYFWDPFLIQADDIHIQETGEGFSVAATYWRNYPYVTEHLRADYRFQPLGGRACRLDFKLVPVTATGYFLEAGVSWILPEGMDGFQWIGDGPLAVYPDRNGDEHFGIHRMVRGDLHFNGNRSGVQLALVTDAAGNGLALLADGANIAVESLGGRVVLSYNSLVSGTGHKKTQPKTCYPAAEVESFGGSLILIPLQTGCWPPAITRVFQGPGPLRAGDNPFWYSYDSTL